MPLEPGTCPLISSLGGKGNRRPLKLPRGYLNHTYHFISSFYLGLRADGFSDDYAP